MNTLKVTIEGPQGCGKSQLAEALRWMLKTNGVQHLVMDERAQLDRPEKLQIPDSTKVVVKVKQAGT